MVGREQLLARRIETMKTIKVKIALALDEENNWYAAGWEKAPDQDLINEVTVDTGLKHIIATYFIEARIPIPEGPKTIRADTVEPVQERATEAQ